MPPSPLGVGEIAAEAAAAHRGRPRRRWPPASPQMVDGRPPRRHRPRRAGGGRGGRVLGGAGVRRPRHRHGMHEEPEVPNYGHAGHRARSSRPGNVLAVEPMVNVGTRRDRAARRRLDAWSPPTGRSSAHVEHTIAVTDDGPEVFTLPVSAASTRAVAAECRPGSGVGAELGSAVPRYRRPSALAPVAACARPCASSRPADRIRRTHAAQAQGRRDRARGDGRRAAPERHVPGRARERPQGPRPHLREDAHALHPHPARATGSRSSSPRTTSPEVGSPTGTSEREHSR